MRPFPDSIRRVSSVDGTVLLDIRRGAMFRVNPLGSRVLDLLGQGASLFEVTAQISVEFGMALDVVGADISEFLDCLERHGVLERRGPDMRVSTGDPR